jgi:putative phosphoribosyl transferase
MREPVTLPLENRAAAGRALAQEVRLSTNGLDLVLALPRGGVAIGAEIASALGLPLDVFLVRKVGAPDQPELALGALAESGHLELNAAVLDSLQVSQEDLASIVAGERLEIERRLEQYRGGRSAPDVKGKRILVVDDGVATGATMLVALRALRAQQPARLIVATPVCPHSTLRRLENEADQIVVLTTPQPFGAVGAWYRDFHQMTDDEVITLLRGGPSSEPRS